MNDKLEMPLEQLLVLFAEAVAKENARLNGHNEKLKGQTKLYFDAFNKAAARIEKLEKTLNDVIETLDLDYSNEIPYMLRNRYACTIAKLGLGDKK